MKKIVFLTCLDYNEQSTGIEYKIYRQFQMIKNSGMTVTAVNPYKNSLVLRLLSQLPFVNIKFDYSSLYRCDCDCIFIRYYMCSSSFLVALKKMKDNNPKLKIFIEIPTYPYDGELPWFNIRNLKDKVTRNYLKKYVDKFITYSKDKEIFGVSTVCISNGVDCSRIPCRNILNTEENTIHMIAVAFISEWHGYDRVILGLKNYYSNPNHSENIIFHIVGNGNQDIIENYKDMIEKYDLTDHVIMHGEKKGLELDELFNISSLAFDSLARHRSGVYYNSSLKGKEYLARGIPSVSGVETELDNVTDFPYYYRVAADDTPIDFVAILDFYNKVYKDTNQVEVVSKIRSYCEAKFDLNITFRPVIDLINSI